MSSGRRAASARCGSTVWARVPASRAARASRRRVGEAAGRGDGAAEHEPEIGRQSDTIRPACFFPDQTERSQ
ncbi:acyl-CoA dehydrogenase [Burkholderia pseudomallei 305]|nr:acyl-CoA dehydrogenase [Burkholderia pseudomallei 305]